MDTVPLRDYQREGAEFLAETVPGLRARILAFAPGLGKTRSALAAAQWTQDRFVRRPITVLSPAIAMRDWEREAKTVWPELPIVIFEGTFERSIDRTLKAFRHNQRYLNVMTHDMAGKVLDRLAAEQLFPGLTIVDEAHVAKKATRLSVRKAQNIKRFVALSEHGFLLTGTPVHNRAMDLHGLIEMCRLGALGAPMMFAEKYFSIEVNTFGQHVGRVLDEQGLRAAVAPYLMVRTAAEVWPKSEFPPRIFRLVTVPGNVRFRSATRDAITAGLRASAAHKIQPAIDLVNELEEPIVLYTHMKEQGRRIHEGLTAAGITSLVANGDLTTKRRDQVIELWKSGGAQVLVCTMDAVSVSATLTRASAMIFADFDYLPGTMIQCMGRTDPSRQPENNRRPSRYYLLVTEHGDDHRVADLLLEKIHETQIVSPSMGEEFESALKDMRGRNTTDEEMLTLLASRLRASSKRRTKLGVVSQDMDA